VKGKKYFTSPDFSGYRRATAPRLGVGTAGWWCSPWGSAGPPAGCRIVPTSQQGSTCRCASAATARTGSGGCRPSCTWRTDDWYTTRLNNVRARNGVHHTDEQRGCGAAGLTTPLPARRTSWFAGRYGRPLSADGFVRRGCVHNGRRVARAAAGHPPRGVARRATSRDLSRVCVIGQIDRVLAHCDSDRP
jgi:hypothetical protein